MGESFWRVYLLVYARNHYCCQGCPFSHKQIKVVKENLLQLFFVDFTDVDECKNKKLCPGENEHCENMPGFYTCKCDTGFTRKEGKCIKGKEKKKKQSKTPKNEDEELLDEVKKGNFIQDWHLKVGSLLYAVFFALLLWAFSKRSAVGVTSLVVLYLGVLFGIRTKYNADRV